MKKLFFVFTLLLTTVTASAQFDLGNLVKDITAKVIGTSEDLTSEGLIGTWKYTSPTIILESDNLIAQVGSKVTTATLQKKLAGYLEKVGIKEGCVTLLFNKDNTLSVQVVGRSVSGMWSLENAKLVFTMGKTGKVPSVKSDAKIQDSNLQIVLDSDILLQVLGVAVKEMGKLTSSVSGILDKYKGMKVGLEFTKE